MSRTSKFFAEKSIKAIYHKGKNAIKEAWTADKDGKGALIGGLGLSALLAPFDPMAAADVAATVTSAGAQNGRLKEELARARHAEETGEGLDDLSGRHSAFSKEGLKEIARQSLVDVAEMATRKPDSRTWAFLGGLAITTAISSVPVAGPATVLALQFGKQVIRKEADHRAWKAAEARRKANEAPAADAPVKP